MMHLRCSSLPLVLRCRAAAEPVAIPIHETNGAADTGTETHRHLAGGGVVPPTRVDWSAMSSKDVRFLVAAGMRAWESLGLEHLPAYDELELKATIGDVTLTGHADSVLIGEHVATIPDWKTGRLDADCTEQLRGYANLVMRAAPSVERVNTFAIWLRDQEVYRHTFVREDLVAWERRIEKLGDPWDGRYEAGSHCDHCPRAHECPAANALARRDASAILDLDLDALTEGIASLEPERILDLLRLAKRIEGASKRVRDAVKAHVVRCGRELATASGTRLVAATEDRREVDAFTAWPILLEYLDDRALSECVEVHLSKVEDAVGKAAGKGNGARAKRLLAERLEEANAITTTQTTRLVERRA